MIEERCGLDGVGFKRRRKGRVVEGDDDVFEGWETHVKINL